MKLLTLFFMVSLILLNSSGCFLNKKIDTSRLSSDDIALLDTLRSRIYKVKNKTYSFRFHHPVSPDLKETVYTKRMLEYKSFLEFIQSKKTGRHFPNTGITYEIMKKKIGNPSRIVRQGTEALLIYYDLDFGYNCNKEKKDKMSICNFLQFNFDRDGKLHGFGSEFIYFDIEPANWWAGELGQ